MVTAKWWCTCVCGCLLLTSLVNVSSAEPHRFTASKDGVFVVAPGADFSRKAILRAEQLRSRIAQKWIGEELSPLASKTIINIALADDLDYGVTIPSRNKDLVHLVFIKAPTAKAAMSALGHEMVHVVLETRFPGGLPAWIQEGIASTFDDDERNARRDQHLRSFASSGVWPSLIPLFEAAQLHRGNEEDYAVAASVCEFLLERESPTILLRCAQLGLQTGWDDALLTYYGTTTAQLQTDWRSWVRNRQKSQKIRMAENHRSSALR